MNDKDKHLKKDITSAWRCIAGIAFAGVLVMAFMLLLSIILYAIEG